MLPLKHRIVDRVDYQRVHKAGRKSSGDWFVVTAAQVTGATRFGFITPKTVGSAVVRNRIRRRLRHLAADTVREYPTGWEVVVRVVRDGSTVTAEQLREEWRRRLEMVGIA